MTNDNAYGLGYDDGIEGRHAANPYENNQSLSESYFQGYGHGCETRMDI